MTDRLEGFYSGPERSISQREAAALRPAKKNAPRPRPKPVLREVTSGIVCFCGERFGEPQALEFMLHLRAEVGEILGQHERQRQRNKDWQRNKRVSDPEWRERENARNRAAMLRRSRQKSKPCECGCGAMTAGRGKRFLPGHNYPRGALQPCGTEAAYLRHWRHGEMPCQPCKDAHAKHQRDKRHASAS